ncbi:unnamed protein product [Absidia cylindrospora]
MNSLLHVKLSGALLRVPGSSKIGAAALTKQPRLFYSSSTEQLPKPLAGIKVLELGQLIAGPFCGSILGYYGAGNITTICVSVIWEEFLLMPSYFDAWSDLDSFSP